MNWLAALLRVPVHLYRWFLSPLLGPRCRFAPSCSEYALDALARHGPFRGSWLTLQRLARCHPWGGSGWDPVPPLRQSTTESHRQRSHPMLRCGCPGH